MISVITESLKTDKNVVHESVKIDELILRIFKIYVYIESSKTSHRFLWKIQDENNFINYELLLLFSIYIFFQVKIYYFMGLKLYNGM